jgi:hypothetical protein
MPSTVRVSIALTTPETNSNDNVEALAQGQYGQRQRWNVPFNASALQFDWSPTGEKNVFLQIWQQQSNVGDAHFRISHAGSDGWASVIPPVGVVLLMLTEPETGGVVFIDCDNALHVDAVFF